MAASERGRASLWYRRRRCSSAAVLVSATGDWVSASRGRSCCSMTEANGSAREKTATQSQREKKRKENTPSTVASLEESVRRRRRRRRDHKKDQPRRVEGHRQNGGGQKAVRIVNRTIRYGKYRPQGLSGASFDYLDITINSRLELFRSA